MSPLWSDLALARAAWAKAESNDSVEGGKVQSLQTPRSVATHRPVRRVLHPRLSSLAL